MDTINNSELQEVLKSHQAYFKGKEMGKIMEPEFLYQKTVKDFVFSAIDHLGGYPIQDSVFKNCIFINSELSALNFSGSKFKSCNFINTSFIKTEMIHTEFLNCVFKNCNFFRAQLIASINNCVIKDCQLKNMILSNSTITSSVFQGISEKPISIDNTEEAVIWNLVKPTS